MTTFLEKFTVLRGAVRELWIIYLTKVLAIIAYAMMNSTLVLWLSADLGYGDKQAGYMIATWSTVLSLVTVLVGSLTDAVGIRKAFLMGFVFCMVSRVFMAFTSAKWLVLPFGLFLVAVGEALMVPVMIAAVRRYSTTSQRSMAFSIFYALMNLGFALAGWMFDFVRKSLGEHGSFVVPLLGSTLSTYRVIFLLSLIFTLPGMLIVYFGLREGVEATDEGVRITPEPPRYPGRDALTALGLMCRDTLKETLRIFAGLWQQPTFYKFLAFLTLAVFVKLIFYHFHYTYPKYGIRELGEGAPIGRLWSINPTIILILVPIVGALTQKFTAYRMVTVGSFLSAVSVFFMAVPPEWFQPLADGWIGRALGHGWLGLTGPVHPLYIAICLAIVVLSVGEALWSPRLYEYTAAIAPKGQEASYMSLSILPYFVAKFFVGVFSGHLLTTYCPAEGTRHSGTLWAIVGLTTLITPAGLVLFRRLIQVHEAGRDEAPAH